MAFLEKIFGSYSKKELARIEPIKQKVLDLESKYADMPTKELQAQTAVLKGRLKNGETSYVSRRYVNHIKTILGI